jgi:hypothetical protein
MRLCTSQAGEEDKFKIILPKLKHVAIDHWDTRCAVCVCDHMCVYEGVCFAPIHPLCVCRASGEDEDEDEDDGSAHIIQNMLTTATRLEVGMLSLSFLLYS